MGRRLAGHRGVRAAVAVLPAIRGVQAALAGHDTRPAEAKFERDLLLVLVLGARVRRYETRVVLDGREHVARRKISRAQPVLPWHPCRSKQRLWSGQQHHLVHRRELCTRRTREGDRPTPAAVARDIGREVVRDDSFGHCDRAQMLADLALGDL